MKMFLTQLLCAWVVLALIHISAMALAGHLFGVRLREISFGFGKVIVSRGLVTIRCVPLGGFVKFKDTRTDVASGQLNFEAKDAYNQKPKLVQALIPLIGSAALVLVALLIRADTAFHELIAGFRQIGVGAIAPLSKAQEYIRATYALAANAGFVAALGLLAAKVAAFNLLPFPWTNGGQALLALLRVDGTSTPSWQERLTPIAFVPFLALLCLWGVAFCAFVIKGS